MSERGQHIARASLLLIAQLCAAVVVQAQEGAAALPGPVTRDYFGLVMSRADPAHPWPSVPFGSWRLWDAYTNWPQLEPRPGQWDFTRLDRLVAEAQQHGVKPLLVLAHSPAWASARPAEASAYRHGVAAEPARLADWSNYVRTVGERYKGRIREYQVWNEPSDKGHYTGTVDNLVQLTCEAQRILKAIDPGILVVSPGSSGPGRHIKYLDSFLAAGGAACIDVVAHHFYVPRFGPEAMVPMIREVRQVMARRGVGKLPLWNTESGWWIANTDGTPDHDMVAKGGWRKLDADREAGAVIQRAFLLARAEGVERFYWYAWNNPYGWGLSDSAGMPKPAAADWQKIFSILEGAHVSTCIAQNESYACEIRSTSGAKLTLKWSDADSTIAREGPRRDALRSEATPR